MSSFLYLSKLSEEVQKYISEHLLIKSKNSYNPFSFNKHKEPDTIEAYTIKKEIIQIPYFTATQLFKTNLNFSLPFLTCNFTSTIQLYDYQEIIYQQALEQLKTYGTTTLFIYTGSGKTQIAIKTAVTLNHLIIVMVTNLQVARQWVEKFTKLTNIVPYFVDANLKIPEGVGALICMDERLHHLPQEVLLHCGTLIIDEAHTFCTNMRYKALLNIRPKYIIAATATFKKANGMDQALFKMLGTHHIYRRSTKPFNVYKYYTGIDVPIKKTRFKNMDFVSLLKDLCHHPSRNALIIDLILRNPGYKILVMSRRVDHVDLLYKQLTELKQSVEYMHGTKKTYHDSRILLGTIQKIGTGFDEESACADFAGYRINLLILVATIKDDALLEQVVGRAFRSEYPNVVHFVDEPEVLKNAHWKIAEKWYLSRNGNVVNMFSPYYQKMTEMRGGLEKVEDKGQEVTDEILERVMMHG